ncbi:MAG TPA: pyruvate kinase [Bryobacteraceae bacterium]|nr:pyruvate kinase [Bryobacteraceae bacterium]
MRTKIVATLGPATQNRDSVRSLIDAGVDVFRLNASHGTPEEHERSIKIVRETADDLRKHIGILLDLQGPKIRLGTFETGSAVLATGQRFAITVESVPGTAQRASTTYKDFVKDVKPGQRVLIADGAVELRVVETSATDAICEVVAGGEIRDRQGINLPGADLSVASLTKKDLTDLRWGMDAGVDLVALSFVRRREDVMRLKLWMDEAGCSTPVIAKIEKPEGWKNLGEILEESDGVMVARGDLGVEIALERVPFIQKSIIARARRCGKFVITATQMLESMIEHPYPTRAEVSDVANAIYDGTDAVMLSAETSRGAYPVDSVKMMARIAVEAEKSLREHGYQELPRREHPTYADIIADMAYRAVFLQDSRAVCVFTASGSSARLVSRHRPPVPIYAFTTTGTVARRLSVIYGVEPVLVDDLRSTDDMMAVMDRTLLEKELAQKGDGVVFVAGQPIGRPGTTNLIKLHRVGELRT